MTSRTVRYPTYWKPDFPFCSDPFFIFRLNQPSSLFRSEYVFFGGWGRSPKRVVMKLELRPIDRSNYEECIKLHVLEGQKDFVAPNIYSLVQAAYEPNFFPLGVYEEEVMVGFILYDFDEELAGWSMSRFMIDGRHQQRGLGKRAVQTFLHFFETKYCGEALYTSAEVDNTRAIGLYSSLGFVEQEKFSYAHGGKTYHEVRMKKVFIR